MAGMDAQASPASGARGKAFVKSACRAHQPCWMVKHSSIRTVVQLMVGLWTSKQSAPFFCLSPRAHHQALHFQISPSIARLIWSAQAPGKMFVLTGRPFWRMAIHAFMPSRALIFSCMAVMKLSRHGPIMASLNAGASGLLAFPALQIWEEPQNAATGRFSNSPKHGSAH